MADRPVEIYTRQEVNALLKAASSRSLTGLRTRALIVLAYRSGLRCAEALALREQDINFDAGTIRVLRGKGAKARTVGIDPQAAAVVSSWITAKRAAGLRSRTLFCTLDGKPMDTPNGARYVRRLMPALAARAGIVKRVHYHGLRHTFASELAEEGVPVHVIQAQLGHSSLATTDVYIRHLNPQQVISAIRNRGDWA